MWEGATSVGSSCHAEELDFLSEQVTEQVRWACEITVAPGTMRWIGKGGMKAGRLEGAVHCRGGRSRGLTGGCASENGEKGLKTQ